MKSRVQLYRAFDFASAWEHLLSPWFEARRARNATDPLPPLPAAVLVPTMAYGQFLKSQLVAAGIPIMGVHFLTPGECWLLLCNSLGLNSRVASREDLHLLLSLAAAEFPAVPSARSIAADPAAFMRCLDPLAAAGWDWTDLNIKTLHPLIARFRALLKEAGLQVAQDVDHQLARQTASADPVFSSLLVIGFDGRHWPVWSLLNAAVRVTKEATVCLHEPRPTAADIDQVWVGSWEETCGEAASLPPSATPSELAALTIAMEEGVHAPSMPVSILVGNDLRVEARSIVAQAMAYLADASCRRLHIVFPGPGPLARETTRLLSEHQIPHNDSLGHNGPPAPSDLAWREWLALHEQPGVQRFLSFLALCPEAEARVGLPLASVEDQLRQAYEELMVDDLQVLTAHLRRPLQGNLQWLPATATFAEFVAATCEIIRVWPSLGGDERLSLIREEAASFDAGWRQPLFRRVFVRWLREITANTHRVRDVAGGHPYARVQLLAYDKAEWQASSHLILAGLNRNSWPPDYQPQPFLDPTLIDQLNSRAIAQGSQGEGHRVARPGKGLIISPAERSAHVRRQFYNIVESATTAACFTASRTDPGNTSRPWNPSDLLVRAHAAVFGTGLSDARMDELETVTARWLNASNVFGGAPLRVDDEPIRQTRRAFDARRDETKPFGPWEFALRTPPTPSPTIPCTAWQTAIDWPELVWMEHFLNVADASWSPEEIPWAKVMGQWVHRWVHAALGSARSTDAAPHPFPSRDVLTQRLAAATQETLTRAEKAFDSAGRPLPDWWRLVHQQAKSAAESLAQAVAALIEQGWSHGATEWRLPDPTRIALPSGGTLSVRGRMDLVMLKDAAGPHWVIDYKTGSAPNLTPAGVAGGGALQLLLYGLALRDTGHPAVLMSFATPEDDVGDPKDIGELLAAERVTATLDLLGHMQERGTFGMGGDLRPEHGFAPAHPLATLRINLDVLKEKQQLTFGQAGGDES